ncbi:MAG TPA: AMP-binding protein [Arenimonas sp.]|uniref:AMP-binding protein n=1 Tax=Arenimonas sp. TaxID=1872635 RepID=UPI002D7E8884|nr:AMP-binding protein [Arenimonas sp.]HEU0153720.1 AMP-binding protein [Arenimonas sp.]
MATERTRIPLARRLAWPLPGDAPVATDAGNAAFLGRVAAWREAFAAREGGDFALYLDDGLEFAAALFGAWAAGKTPWLPGDRLPSTLASLDPHVHGRAGELPDGFLADASPGTPAAGPALDPETCQVVLFTSGSTGEPGPIRKSLRQLDSEVAALEACFGATLGNAVVQGTVSHQHIYGLLFRLLWPLSAGRAFARHRVGFNEQLAALGDGPLALVASPAHLKRLPENQDWRGLARSLRATFSSGGPLPADAAQAVRQLWGQAAIEVFGSTETGGIAWRQSGGAPKPWQPLPGVAWRVQDGVLAVRSPHLADDDWYRTADRAQATAGGGFELRGRVDRILKLEERRISLGAIERRLQASPLLVEARLLPLPGHRILLAVAAVPSAEGQALLDAAGKPALVAALRAWLADHADAIALPRRWRFVDALPADAQGKSSQRALAALFRPLLPEPEWQVRTSTSARVGLDVQAELAAFEGHFPGATILPGVAMIDWAVRLGRLAFGLEGRFLRMEAIKFMHLVRPGSRLEASLDWHPDTGVLGFRFQSDIGVHSSGRLRFAIGEAA